MRVLTISVFTISAFRAPEPSEPRLCAQTLIRCAAAASVQGAAPEFQGRKLIIAAWRVGGVCRGRAHDRRGCIRGPGSLGGLLALLLRCYCSAGFGRRRNYLVRAVCLEWGHVGVGLETNP